MASFKNESTYKAFLGEGREGEFDRLFDLAVSRAKSEVIGRRFPIYINGKEVYAREEIAEYSPIDHTLIGRFQKGTREEAKAAIAAASASSGAWAGTGYRERIKILRKAAGLFSRDKFAVAAVLSIENGKTRYESVGEVDEAIDFLNYYASEMERNRGYSRRTRQDASANAVGAGFQGAPGRAERVAIAMKAYGVFGVIAPFNFPISISTGMSSAALITGNTVVFKPSSTDNMAMLTGLMIYRIFMEAGVPPGAFNYVTGPGSEVGDELAVNPKVDGIAFTGSRKTGLGMLSKAVGLGQSRAFVVEMGGKNPAIVSKYADLDAAAEGIASAAFGYSGQKCSACSRVYVHDSLKEQFISKLIGRARSMKIGDPLKKENYMGPLISDSAVQRYKEAVEEAKRDGRILYGGKAVGSGGLYVEPVIAELGQESRLMHDELFIPFLAIDTYRDFGSAIDKANDTEYGLCAGLYSRKGSEIREFFGRIKAGVTYVNRETSATTGAMVGLHAFVGWKSSGMTGKGTGSRFYLEQFMREQSQATVR